MAVQARRAAQPLPGQPEDHRLLVKRRVPRGEPGAPERPADRLLLRLPDGERAAEHECEQGQGPGGEHDRPLSGGALLAGLPSLRSRLSPADPRGPGRRRLGRCPPARLRRRTRGVGGIPGQGEPRQGLRPPRALAGLAHAARPAAPRDRVAPRRSAPAHLRAAARRQRDRPQGAADRRGLPVRARMRRSGRDGLRDRVVDVQRDAALQRALRARARLRRQRVRVPDRAGLRDPVHEPGLAVHQRALAAPDLPAQRAVPRAARCAAGRDVRRTAAVGTHPLAPAPGPLHRSLRATRRGQRADARAHRRSEASQRRAGPDLGPAPLRRQHRARQPGRRRRTPGAGVPRGRDRRWREAPDAPGDAAQLLPRERPARSPLRAGPDTRGARRRGPPRPAAGGLHRGRAASATRPDRAVPHGHRPVPAAPREAEPHRGARAPQGWAHRAVRAPSARLLSAPRRIRTGLPAGSRREYCA